MTYAPDQIYGPIIPKSNGSQGALPGVTFNSVTQILTTSGVAKELYTRPTNSTNLSGNTADYAGQIFLNSDFLAFPQYMNLIYGFVPNYYIDCNKNTQSTMTKTTGSFYLPKGTAIPGGNKESRWEVLTISYNTASFLTNLSGASSTAITGLNITHNIISGGQTLTAEHIFYRKIGELS
jgi:hypothetical protein